MHEARKINVNEEKVSVYKTTLREKCPHSKFFWSTFPRIRTKYEERERESKCGKLRTRKTPYTGTSLVKLPFIV